MVCVSSHCILLLIALSTLTPASVALKFLAFSPMFFRSHSNFLGKLSDTLIDAGHEVVMLVPIVNKKMGTIGSEKARVITVPQSEVSLAFERKMDEDEAYKQNNWHPESPLKLIGLMFETMNIFLESCNSTLRHPGLIEQLREERFDASFGEVMFPCYFPLVHLAGIEKFALTQSVVALDGMFEMSGAPAFPSYVPGMISPSSDRMSFFERMANAVAHVASKALLFGLSVRAFEGHLSEWRPGMPSYAEMAANTSLVFMNAEPLIDFPKVTTHKLIDIGGISVPSGHNALNETWNEILSLRPKNVLMSFGTIHKSSHMPNEYKESIRAAFSRFPDVTFIWKYEVPEDDIGKGIPNIVTGAWLPQNDLLHDARLTLFITHCGAGSTIEATVSGVPLIVVPIHGDQWRNAQTVKRLGTGVTVEKEQLNTPDALVNAIQTLFDEPKYAEAAKRTAAMLASRPFSMKEIFVRNMEFLAKFGPLRNLDHYGVQLNFFQYYLLDVIAFITVVLLLFLGPTIFVLQWIIRKIIALLRARKANKEYVPVDSRK